MVADDVQSVIGEVIRERLEPVKVISVHAIRDDDLDGEEVLRVTVVVDSPASAFDPKRLSSLVRYLRPKLAERQERAFPLISFMSTADAKAFAL